MARAQTPGKNLRWQCAALRSIVTKWLPHRGRRVYADVECWAQPGLPLAPRLFSFPFFSTAPSLFLSIFPGKLRGNRQILGSEPSLRLVWAQNQPNFRPNRQNAGNFAENPCKPGNYPATAWVFCRFPQFCLRFCPRPALRLRETREFPEWSTKHPLFSLEISGNAKCWGPSVFLFVCRKTSDSPRDNLSPRS